MGSQRFNNEVWDNIVKSWFKYKLEMMQHNPNHTCHQPMVKLTIRHVKMSNYILITVAWPIAYFPWLVKYDWAVAFLIHS